MGDLVFWALFPAQWPLLLAPCQQRFPVNGVPGSWGASMDSLAQVEWGKVGEQEHAEWAQAPQTAPQPRGP